MAIIISMKNSNRNNNRRNNRKNIIKTFKRYCDYIYIYMHTVRYK